jgi:hypothetical protein
MSLFVLNITVSPLFALAFPKCSHFLILLTISFTAQLFYIDTNLANPMEANPNRATPNRARVASLKSHIALHLIHHPEPFSRETNRVLASHV